MKFIYAFLVILACFIPILIGAGFGLDALIGYCTRNSTCLSVEICVKAKCQDPCDNTKCGENARCLAYNHTAVCECLPHYKGDPTWKCEKTCQLDIDCGRHAKCRDFGYGVKLCECKKKYYGDPWIKCQKHCLINDTCDPGEVCKHGNCTDA